MDSSNQGQNAGHGQGQQQANQPQAAATPQQRAALQAMMQQDPYKGFLKPDQFTLTNFPIFSQQQLDQYRSGFRGFWDTLVRNPRESQLHQVAVNRLGEASRKIMQIRKDEMAKQQQRGQVAQNQSARQVPNTANGTVPPQNGAQIPTSQSQPQAQLQQTQNSQAGNQSAQAGKIPGQSGANPSSHPPDGQMPADRQNWALPAHINEGTEQARNYRAETTRRYGDAINKYHEANNKLKNVERLLEQAKSSGDDTTQATKNLNEQKAGLQTIANEARSFAQRLLNIDSANKEAHESAARGNVAGQNGQQPGNAASNNNLNQTRPVPGTLPNSGNAQFSRPPGSGAGPQVNPQGLHQANAGLNIPGRQAPNMPNVGNQSQHTGSGDAPAFGYTPQQAVALSRSRESQQSPTGQTPQTAQAFQQDRQTQQGDVDQRRPGQPISKGWQPQPPTPVSMGQARPTLSGPGSGPLGAMGQPAIQKQDTFLLQGPGDRVLDKKKLDELVRQVCGADAAEGDALLPEVEEVR